MKRIFPWIALLAAACAPAAKAPRKPVEEEAFVLDTREDPKAAKGALTSSSGSHKTAAITFLPNRVRAPALHGTVHKNPTWMLLDTGASTHFVADWMVHRIFADDVSENVSDHIGRSIRMSRLDQPQIALDGWGAAPDVTAMITSGGMEDSDLGVTLSPQKLVAGTGGAIVLDFPNKTMAFARSRDVAERSLERGNALAPASKCNGVYFLNAKVGDTDAKLLLDTGAWASDLKPLSAPAHALMMQTQDGIGRGYGAGGAITSRRLPKIPVTSGKAHFEVDIQLLDQSSETGACRSDGVLGMDFLQNCVLVIDDGAITGRCGGV